MVFHSIFHWLINSKDENFLGIITVTIEPDISPIPTVIKNYDASYENNAPQNKGVIIPSYYSNEVFCLLS